MKALVCDSYGPPENLKFQELSKPTPKDDEVLIKVKSVGINYPDTLTIQGKDQYGLMLPFVPGREYAGIVEDIGPEVTHLHVGDRVLVDVMHGALQEYACASIQNVHKIPDSMSFKEASVFIITYGTAYHALVDRANLKQGETLAILGAAGGVGSAAMDIGKSIGATVIACGGTKEKLDYCYAHGADHGINYDTEDLKKRLKELTNGKGVNVLCDMVGDQYSDPAFRAMAWEGRFLVIGFAAGNIARIPLNLPLLKGASLIGVFFSTFCSKFPEAHKKNTQILLDWYDQGKLKPQIYKEYSFSDTERAFNDLSNRKVKGKISIKLN